MRLELSRAPAAFEADCGHKIRGGAAYLKADNNHGAVRWHCADCGLALLTLANLALKAHEWVWTEES